MGRTALPSLPPLLLAAALVVVAGVAGCTSAEERAAEHKRKGYSLLSQGSVNPALDELRAAYGLTKEPEVGFTIASLHGRAGDLVGAAALYREVLAEHPNQALGHYQLAAIYLQLGELDRALESFARVCGLLDHPPSYYGIAEIWQRRGSLRRSEEAVRAALRIAPQDPEGHFRLARLLDEAGVPEARAQWERFIAVAGGAKDLAPLVADARARLRALALALGPEDRRAVLAAARQLLEAGALAPGAGSAGAAAAAGSTAALRDARLKRLAVGRVFLALYRSGQAPVRGAGEGATLVEAIGAAARDVQTSRVFDLFYARELDAARLEVAVESARAEPLSLTRGPTGEPALAGEPFHPGEEGLELRLPEGARSIVLLPSDLAARGLATLRAALEAAAGDLGLRADEWPRGTAYRVRAYSFVSAGPPGRDDGIGLEGGLPSPPAPTRALAVAAARDAALWAVHHQTPDGRLARRYDPVRDEYQALPGDSTHAHAAMAHAILAAQALSSDPRLLDSARLALAWLREHVGRDDRDGAAYVTGDDGRPSVGATAATLRALLRLAPPAFDAATAGVQEAQDAALRDALAAWLVREALSGFGGATTIPADVPRALGELAAAGKPVPEALDLLMRGVADPARVRLEDTAPSEVEAVLQAAGRRRAARQDKDAAAAADDALREAVRALLRLRYDGAEYPFASPSRLRGGFRTAPLDPSVRVDALARTVEALVLAAPLLPVE